MRGKIKALKNKLSEEKNPIKISKIKEDGKKLVMELLELDKLYKDELNEGVGAKPEPKVDKPKVTKKMTKK